MPAISYDDAHGTTTPTGSYFPPVPVGLPPELEAAVQEHKANHYGEPICPQCKAQGSTELYGGRCKHRPTPAQAAEDRRWRAHAKAVWDAQHLGHGGDLAPIVGQDEANQRDSRYGLPSPVERVTIVP